MGRKIVVILLLLVNYAQAQSPKFKKVEKNFLKSNYDKSISKALKLKQKIPNEAEADYYLAISYFEKYKLQNKFYLFKKSIAYYKSGKKIDSQRFSITNVRLSKIHQELKDMAITTYKKSPKQSRSYFNQLVELFNDTTHQYYLLNDLIYLDNQIDSHNVMPNNRQYLLAIAEKLIGTPYKYGGEDTTGFDCSGFVKYVYKKMGIDLPHNAHLISKLGKEIPKEDANIGDVVLFGSRNGNNYRVSHAGMVYKTGEDFTVIHCVSGGVKVALHDWNSHWQKNMLFVKKLIDE